MASNDTTRREGLFRNERSSITGGLHRVFGAVVPDIAQRMPRLRSQRLFTPRVDVREGDSEVRITAELPGMSEAEIGVALAEGALVLRGEKRADDWGTEQEVRTRSVRSERAYGGFERWIPIPAEVDESGVEAFFERGVLTIRMPKTERAKARSRKIEIRTPVSGSSGTNPERRASAHIDTHGEGRGSDGKGSPGINEVVDPVELA